MNTCDDRTVTISILTQPNQANGYGNVHGGEIMKIMDNTAGAAALKYAKTNVVTARVDELQFLEPVHIGRFLTCTATVVYVGTTSMEIRVIVEVEDLRIPGSKKRALDAYFTLVALDGEGHPTPVPPFVPETDEDKKAWEKVRKRRESMSRRRRAR
ncbi:MAG: acyl-CoA thioesterase [Clostridiales Family XIII bacterium]|jgi:acyl-CoA hydrolase|nr:acyl-CoA thioesterase [Clostridiales Family XIII bacterium]